MAERESVAERERVWQRECGRESVEEREMTRRTSVAVEVWYWQLALVVRVWSSDTGCSSLCAYTAYRNYIYINNWLLVFSGQLASA